MYYKYRTLESLDRLRDIFQYQRLYTGRYNEQNDLLEGRYLARHLPQQMIDDIRNQKSSLLFCSLTDSPYNAHMWEEYADNGHGLCIECNVLSKYKSSQIVYDNAHTLVDDIMVQSYSTQDIALEILRHKTLRWGNEHETRFYKIDTYIDDSGRSVQRQPYIKVVITKVFLGWNMSAQEVSFYTEMIQSFPNNDFPIVQIQVQQCINQ